MSGKTFEEYEAEYKKDSYPFPMPGGTTVEVPQPSLTAERAAVAASNVTGNVLTGLLTYVSEEDGQKIAEAWGALPASALRAAIDDMRKYFGTKNSAASPSS